jgi:hypothetical protein
MDTLKFPVEPPPEALKPMNSEMEIKAVMGVKEF